MLRLECAISTLSLKGRGRVSGVDCGRFHKTMLNNFISPLRRPSLSVAQLEGMDAPLRANLHWNSDHVEALTATPPPSSSWIYNFVAFINSNFAWESAIAFCGDSLLWTITSLDLFYSAARLCPERVVSFTDGFITPIKRPDACAH